MEAVLKTSRKQISKNVRVLSGKVDRALVYGCGRYVQWVKAMLGDKVGGWSWYDPYVKGYEICPRELFQYVILDNVLNVIQDNETLMGVVIHALTKVESNGWLYISIYEGDKSGVHTFEGGKCQRNETIGDYAPMFATILGVEVHKIAGGVALRKL